MWRTTLKSLASHKRRLVSTCTAVLLGIAFLAGTLVLGDTMTKGFGDMFTAANAGTDALVRGSNAVGEAGFEERALVDRSLVDEIASVDGVAAAEPRIEGSARIVGADGDPIGGNGPPTEGGNWIADDSLNPYDLAEGRAPETAGEVVIDKAAAEAGDLAVGDTTIVRTPDPTSVTVVGLVTFGEADSQGPITFTGFTTDQAADLFLPGADQVSSIAVAAEPGLGQAALVQRLDTVLPDGVEALTGAELTAEMEDLIQDDFLGFFETFLLVFAGIALVVATFSIYNTFSIIVAQRTRESALLRALGASRGQVMRSVGVEALIVGVVASALGIVAGLGLASGLLALMDAVGFTMPASSLVVSGGTVVTALVFGVVVTLAASLLPAWRASRTAPLAAIREVAVDGSATSRLRAVLGVVVTGAGVALVIAGAFGPALSQAGLGALVTLLGVVMLGPVVARPAAGVLGAPQAARPGMSGVLARRNAMRNPRRTAGTALALLVGVAVVSLMTVVAASIKQSVTDTVDEQFAGDLVIVSDDFNVGGGLSPDLATSVADMPEVETVTAVGNAPIRLDGNDEFGTTFDPASLEQVVDMGVLDGSLADLGTDAVAVSDSYAEDNGLGVGDTLPATYPDGTSADLTVGAVFTNDEMFGGILVTKESFAPHTRQVGDVAAMLSLADGVSLADGEAAVQGVADRFSAPDVQTGAEYADSVGGEVDQMLNVVYALLAFAIVIALMGIANTLSLSIHERTRELGLLRAVGQSRRQLRAMIRGEAVTVALFGTAGGVGLGLFLGWAVVEALADEGFTAFAIPTTSLVVVLVVGALAGILAAVRPARRAARMDVLQAIATD